MTKEDRQNISINKVINNNFNGILNLCVRFGKTRIGLKIYKKLLELNKTVLIITPSSTIKEQWIKETELVDNIKPIIVTSYQLLNLDKSINIDAIIVDEAHKYVSSNNYKILNGSIIKFKHCLLLTASLPIGDKYKKLIDIVPVIDTIKESEAINNNWIANYIEYNIPLQLSEQDCYTYVKHTNTIATIFNKYNNLHNLILYNNKPLFTSLLDLINACSRGKYIRDYGYIAASNIRKAIITKMRTVPDENWNEQAVEEDSKLFIKAITNRNNLLNSNSAKLKAVLYIYSVLTTPTICFNDSINFTDRLVDTINNLYGNIALAIHSKLKSAPLINPETNDYYRYVSGKRIGEPKPFSKKKQLEYAIASIEFGNIQFISAAKALDEGITIPRIDCIITTSGSMNPIQYEQRSGRAKTLLNSNKVAKIYNLYFEDFELDGKLYISRDKTKLKNRQIRSESIKIINLQDV